MPTTAFDNIAGDVMDIIEDQFWGEINYNGNIINALVEKQKEVETQDGIYNADAVIVVRIGDVPSPVYEVDRVTIDTVLYVVSSQLDEDDRSFTLICNRIP